MKNYIVVKASGVAIAIGLEDTEIEGFCETVLESFLPEDNELLKWDDEKVEKFIAENNTRMEAICKFLNEKQL